MNGSYDFILAGIVLVILGIFPCIRCFKRSQIDSSNQTSNIEDGVENNEFEEIEIAEQEIEPEIETEVVFQIEMNPNAPPPDYNEIEYNSTAIPKRSYVTSSSSLPAYEDI